MRVGVACTLLLLAGCDRPHICTLMYVPDQLTLQVEPPIETAGSWRIEADGQGCTVELPLSSSVFDCDVPATYSTDGDALTGVSLEYFADEVTLRVLQDDVELFVETRVPEWSESEPNGDGCGVTRVGTEVIEL